MEKRKKGKGYREKGERKIGKEREEEKGLERE